MAQDDGSGNAVPPTHIELDSLELFTGKAEGFVQQVNSGINLMNLEISAPVFGINIDASVLPSGNFKDARDLEGKYVTLYNEYCDRVDRLRHTLETLKLASQSIHEGYTTTEERNNADANTVAREMSEAEDEAASNEESA